MNEDLTNVQAELDFSQIQELITQIRSLRKEYGVAEKSKIALQVIGVNESLSEFLRNRSDILDKMAGVDNVVIDGIAEGSGANTVLKDGTEVFIPLAGVIDLDKECAKLSVEIKRLEGLVEGTRRKLANEKFLTSAPPNIVEKERLKEESFLQQLSTLSNKLSSLSEN